MNARGFETLLERHRRKDGRKDALTGTRPFRSPHHTISKGGRSAGARSRILFYATFGGRQNSSRCGAFFRAHGERRDGGWMVHTQAHGQAHCSRTRAVEVPFVVPTSERLAYPNQLERTTGSDDGSF